MLTIDFQGINGLSQQEIIHNLLTQVYHNIYVVQILMYSQAHESIVV